MRNARLIATAAAAVATVGLSANALRAAVVETDSYNTTGYTVSSTDLANGITPGVTGTPLGNQDGASNDPSLLTDGSCGPSPDRVNSVAISNGAQLTFALNTAAAPSGYDLTGVTGYSAWSDNGRIMQNYTIQVSTDGTTFTNLYTVNESADPGSDSASRVVVADDGTGSSVLASGIKAVRLSFDNVQNGYVGYREFDVFGSATGSSVPEPASIGLAGVAALGLLARRRTA